MSDDFEEYQKSAQSYRDTAKTIREWSAWGVQIKPKIAHNAIHTIAGRLDAAADRIEALESEVERLRGSLRAIFYFAELPFEVKSPVVFQLYLKHARAALSADKTKEE